MFYLINRILRTMRLGEGRTIKSAYAPTTLNNSRVNCSRNALLPFPKLRQLPYLPIMQRMTLLWCGVLLFTAFDFVYTFMDHPILQAPPPHSYLLLLALFLRPFSYFSLSHLFSIHESLSLQLALFLCVVVSFSFSPSLTLSAVVFHTLPFARLPLLVELPIKITQIMNFSKYSYQPS